MAKSVIKKLGMEKEFKNWMKSIESRSVLGIGSRVRVKAGSYTYTTPGSEGIVTAINEDVICVKFDKFTCPHSPISRTFTIERQDLKVIK